MFRQILIVAAFFVSAVGLLRALGFASAGPLVVILSAALAITLVRRGGEGWSALGLARPARPGRMLLQALGLALLGYLTAGLATLLATQGLGLSGADFGRFAHLKGNVPALLGMLAIAWSAAALGEEIVFRGFLQGRLEGLLGGRRGAGLAAVLIQALVFGLAHAYQGAAGMLVTGCVGLVFGLAYRRLRSLWPVVIAHGLVDSLSMLALFAGVMPKA